MKSFLHFKITLLMMSSLVPWPESGPPSAGCSREFSFIVRKFIERKWFPIFDRFKVDIPLSCPLNPERDIFHAFHQSKFPVDSRKWSCSLCGKSFHTEMFLDLHLLRKHPNKLLLVEDSVCPAEFCDLIRCEVLQYAELTKDRMNNQTSPEYQSPKERQQTITALVKASPQVNPLSHYNNHRQADFCLTDDEQCRKKGWLMLPSQLSQPMHCCLPAAPPAVRNPAAEEASSRSSNQTASQCRPNSTTNDYQSDYPSPSSKEEELSARIKQKQSSCRDEDFIQLRYDCAQLIDMCTSGLILRMTNQQFNHLRDDLNRSVCWHLQCDRYWTEVLTESEAHTSALLLIAIAFAAVGFTSSYIIVCIVCQDPHAPVEMEGKGGSDSALNQYNGTTEWDSSAISTRLSVSSSSDPYTKRFIIEAQVEENSLI